MNKSGFNYLKWTAVVAVLAMTFIGLSGLLSMTTIAQEQKETIEKVTAPDREIDLRAKLKDKKFADGRRVVIDTLDSGEKIVAEVKAGDFLNWFLVTADETEVKAEVKIRRRNTTTTTTVTCTAIVHDTHTTTDSKGKQTTVSSSWTIQIPCPGHPAGDTFK